jgi:hypothetical protein
MMKELSYRRKNSMLLGAVLVLMLVAIAGPMRSTVGLFLDNQALTRELQFAKQGPAELARYRSEAKGLNDLIRFKKNAIDLKADILATVSTSVEQHTVLLLNLEEPEVHTENDFAIETHEVVLQGDFVNLLKVLVHLEQNLSSGKIVSSRFVMEKVHTTVNLVLHVYIQTSNQS